MHRLDSRVKKIKYKIEKKRTNLKKRMCWSFYCYYGYLALVFAKFCLNTVFCAIRARDLLCVCLFDFFFGCYSFYLISFWFPFSF